MGTGGGKPTFSRQEIRFSIFHFSFAIALIATLFFLNEK
jgi:hypothetical protein